MRLNVDFSQLCDAVRSMGAESVDVDFVVTRHSPELEPIDIQLSADIEITDLSKIETVNGVLSYEGRQILLHIQDHGHRAQIALDDGSEGNKFHVADCRTLVEMRGKGRFERYVVSNDLSGKFHVTGFDQDSEAKVEGKARLKVCKNCLRELDYQGYQQEQRSGQQGIFARFDLAEFFDTYRSFFSHLPKRRAGEFDGRYTPDWSEISARYRSEIDFRCESCGVNLRAHPQLLHAHHRDGVKTNNTRSNLRALCLDCHSQEPDHEHLECVSREAIRQIRALRRQQN